MFGLEWMEGVGKKVSLETESGIYRQVLPLRDKRPELHTVNQYVGLSTVLYVYYVVGRTVRY
jgi:hypothetical protein